MDELVERLTKEQPVEVSIRPEKTREAFKTAIDRGYVQIHFMGTQGGTELGVRLDPSQCELSGADWKTGSGRVRVVGGLVLNYVKVRCHAQIDLATLAGTGRLEVLEEVTPAELARERAARAGQAS